MVRFVTSTMELGSWCRSSLGIKDKDGKHTAQSDILARGCEQLAGTYSGIDWHLSRGGQEGADLRPGRGFGQEIVVARARYGLSLIYTSDAADERSSVD